MTLQRPPPDIKTFDNTELPASRTYTFHNDNNLVSQSYRSHHYGWSYLAFYLHLLQRPCTLDSTEVTSGTSANDDYNLI